MNIRWVKSRSTKKNKKNTTQAYLRWYENRKAITKSVFTYELFRYLFLLFS